jgi:hypothetical protein
MRPVLTPAAVVLGVVLMAPSARADRAVLVNGEVVVGKVTRERGRVIIDTGSGTITLSDDLVVSVEPGESAVSQFDERYAALRARDVKGRLALAAFCRDHVMIARELQVLNEVLAIDPDNAQARHWLGYVRGRSGWIKRDAPMREQARVRYAGQSTTPSVAATPARDRVEAAAAAERPRQTEELDASARRLARERAELEMAHLRAEAARTSSFSTGHLVYPGATNGWWGTRSNRLGWATGHPRVPHLQPPPPDGTSLPIVTVPYSFQR